METSSFASILVNFWLNQCNLKDHFNEMRNLIVRKIIICLGIACVLLCISALYQSLHSQQSWTLLSHYALNKASKTLRVGVGVDVGNGLGNTYIYIDTDPNNRIKGSLLVNGKLPLVVIVDPLLDDDIMYLGGTGHWYHMTQRILASMQESEEHWAKYYSHEAEKKSGGRPPLYDIDMNSVYIVFQEDFSVKNLGPFMRMVLSSLTAKGDVQNIHFAYATKVNNLKNEIVHLENMQIVFHTNLALNPGKLFLFPSKEVDGLEMEVCGKVLAHITADQMIKSGYQFFPNRKSFSTFQSAVAKTCSISQYDNTANMTNFSVIDDSHLDVTKGIIAGHAKPIVVPSGSVRRIVIYQRDLSRQFDDTEGMASKLKHMLNEGQPESLHWEVSIVYHSDERAPCELVALIQKATVLLSSHGFQSMLLLFQPTDSLLVEVFPKYYFRPKVYGRIQLGLRANTGIARDLLSFESGVASSTLTTWLGPLLSKCVPYSPICRHLLRDQDVYMSKHDLNYLANFILKNIT